jgi:uncharacterized protein YndB with AHSA1/START domain
MPSNPSIDVTVSTTATAEAVWKLLADVETWKQWGPWRSAEIERPGSPAVGGVGAIRHFTYRGRHTREEVVVFEPPSRFAYTLLSGLPLRNYRAEVTIVPSREGAVLEWHSRFDPTLTGRVTRPLLARFIRDVARQLVRAAEAS